MINITELINNLFFYIFKCHIFKNKPKSYEFTEILKNENKYDENDENNENNENDYDEEIWFLRDLTE